MKYTIKKCLDGEIEYLPDIVDTPIWKDFNDGFCSESVILAFRLYQAVAERDNYFQFNTPTAFGNPEYSHACGVVSGILIAGMVEETDTDTQRIFRKGKRVILVVDKIKLHPSHYERVAENKALLAELGF